MCSAEMIATDLQSADFCSFGLQELKQEEQLNLMEISTNQNGQMEAPPPAENKPSAASLPLPPFDPDSPIGEKTSVKHVSDPFYI